MATRRHRFQFTPLAYLVGLLFTALVHAAGEPRLEIIALEHALAADVLPLIKPFVEPGGTATGMNNKLIIKTSPENLAEIRQVLAAFDRPPKTLRITVKQDVAASSTIQEDAVSGRFRSGNIQGRIPDPGSRSGASVGIGDRNGNQIRYRSLNTRSSNDSQNTHFVTTLEGSPALIQTGQSIPVPYQSSRVDPYGVVVHSGVDYRDVSSGFYVTPRTHGREVTLDIAPQLERARGGHRGIIDSRRSQTSVRGRIGEWIALGGVNEADSGSDAQLLARTRRHNTELYNVWVKVEEIP